MKSIATWLNVLRRQLGARAGTKPATRAARPRLEPLEGRLAPAAGALDPTFGTGGKVTTGLGSNSAVANSLAVQADGKLVVAGSAKIGSNQDFALVRYNADG